MLRTLKLLPLFISIILLFSCQSTRIEVSSGIDNERASSAIVVLGEDMISNAAIDISILSLESSIPDSYKAYKEYVPLYEEYKDEYLKDISKIANDAISHFLDEIYDEVVILSSNPYAFISGDTSLTLALKNNLRDRLIEECTRLFSSYSSEFESAFSSSKGEFDSIRNAYLNLSSVGVTRALPVAGKADLHSIAVAAVDSLFDSLATAEKALKNMVVDRSSDSLYSIFWEDR